MSSTASSGGGDVVVIDNGAGDVKAGFAGFGDPICVMPNRTATLPKQLRTLVGDETVKLVKNKSKLRYTIPFDRGYMIDPDSQSQIWEFMLSSSHLDADPKRHSLLVTEPVLNLDSLREQMNELVFETFQFKSAVIATSPQLVAYDCSTSVEMGRGARSGCMLVVDSGFSFTHAVPIYDYSPIHEAIRRVSVGGKLLTNYLKELVSYRAYNMMDETYLINQVKEQLCFCSNDIYGDLKPSSAANKALCREFVLPDYQDSMEGHVRLPDGASKAAGNDGEQVLPLRNERVSVPEVLFHPTDIGLDEGGIANAVIQAIENCPARLRPCLYANIVLAGGTARLPGFRERLLRDVRSQAPTDVDIRIEFADSSRDGEGLALSAWRGGSKWAKDPHKSSVPGVRSFDSIAVGRAEYEELGHDAFRRKRKEFT